MNVVVSRPAAAIQARQSREDLFVVQYGHGRQTTLGLHGWGGSHLTFAALVKHLPPEHALHCPDLPGYGGSCAPVGWTLRTIADPIERWLERQRGGGCTVLANCIGGAVAMELARRRPSAIKRIVLIDPFCFVPIYFRVFTWGSFGRVAYYSTFANPLGRRLSNAVLAQKRTKNTHLTKSFQSMRHETALNYLHVGRQIDVATLCANIRTPVDIVFGSRSFRAVKQSVAQLKSLLSNCRAFELEGAGHLPIQEAAEEVARIGFRAGAIE